MDSPARNSSIPGNFNDQAATSSRHGFPDCKSICTFRSLLKRGAELPGVCSGLRMQIGNDWAHCFFVVSSRQGNDPSAFQCRFIKRVSQQPILAEEHIPTAKKETFGLGAIETGRFGGLTVWSPSRQSCWLKSSKSLIYFLWARNGESRDLQEGDRRAQCHSPPWRWGPQTIAKLVNNSENYGL